MDGTNANTQKLVLEADDFIAVASDIVVAARDSKSLKIFLFCPTGCHSADTMGRNAAQNLNYTEAEAGVSFNAMHFPCTAGTKRVARRSGCQWSWSGPGMPVQSSLVGGCLASSLSSSSSSSFGVLLARDAQV